MTLDDYGPLPLTSIVLSPKLAARILPVLRGVFVGGCVERGIGSSFHPMAHAHNMPTSDLFGWICVRSRRKVLTDSRRPTRTLMHEFAHLLAPGEGHRAAFIAALRSIGQRAEARETQHRLNHRRAARRR